MSESDRLPRVLFLCTGNSCRSQMAHGFARSIHSDLFLAESAGIEAHGLNPHAVHVMSEVGVDIADHRSSKLGDLPHLEFDLVITVCGNADRTCPTFPSNTRVVHVPFDDPPQLARNSRPGADTLQHYSRVRDEIEQFVRQRLPQLLREGTTRTVTVEES